MYPTSDAHYCFTAVHPLLKSVPDYSHPSNFQFPQYYVVTYLSSYQQHDFLTPVVRVDSRNVQAIMSQTSNSEHVDYTVEEKRKRGKREKTGEEREKRYLPYHGTYFLRMSRLSIRKPYYHSFGMFHGSSDVVVYGRWF